LEEQILALVVGVGAERLLEFCVFHRIVAEVPSREHRHLVLVKRRIPGASRSRGTVNALVISVMRDVVDEGLVGIPRQLVPEALPSLVIEGVVVPRNTIDYSSLCE
jgi:hypothetical protein